MAGVVGQPKINPDKRDEVDGWIVPHQDVFIRAHSFPTADNASRGTKLPLAAQAMDEGAEKNDQGNRNLSRL